MVANMMIHNVKHVFVVNRTLENPKTGPFEVVDYQFLFEDYDGKTQVIGITAFMKAEEA